MESTRGDRFDDYIRGFLAYPNPVLARLESEGAERAEVHPHIGMQTGTFLSLLIRLIQAKRVMEFGTCLGYSTVFLAQAVRQTGGRLIAMERDPRLFEDTRRNLEEAGLDSVVDLRCGDAVRLLDEVEGPFDLILQDAAKRVYPVMFEGCVAKLRRFGVLAADDGLFRPMGVSDPAAGWMDEYNRLAFADRRLVSTILPMGDGLTLSVKVSDA